MSDITVYASQLYPYWVINYENWTEYGSLPNSSINISDPSTWPYEITLGFFLTGAGNLTENCSLALDWFNQIDFKAGDDANFGYGNNTINQDFLELAVPNFGGEFSTTADFAHGEFDSLIYDILANASYPVGDAVFNITRPTIELYCVSQELAEVQSLNLTQGCLAKLQRWSLPDFEATDAVGEVIQAFDSLPSQHRNISIQTFWGWYMLQGIGPDEISAQKQGCFQSVCTQTFSDTGNPDVAGIGMFISYIIEAVLATVIILQTCWHNWKHRKVALGNTSTSEALRGRFVEATDTFLNNGIIFLLSLVVALLVVGSHETILYNGIITDLACYFAASAIIAVASMPRRGATQNKPFWIVLLASILMLILATRLAGQYDIPSTFSDTSDELGTEVWVGELTWQSLTSIPDEGYSYAASSYLDGLNFTAPPTSFSVSDCLLYCLFYTEPNAFFGTYLPAAVYIQEIGYLGGLLLFFLLTQVAWPKQLIMRIKWASENWDTAIFYTRSIFSLFALVNMFMALVYMDIWKRFEREATGTYYTEAQVGYGQVLALFLWAPVFATFIQISAKQYSEEWEPKFPSVPFWSHRKKAPVAGNKSQNPALVTQAATQNSTAGTAPNVAPILAAATPAPATSPPTNSSTRPSTANRGSRVGTISPVLTIHSNTNRSSASVSP